jgi:hypothetical protein
MIHSGGQGALKLVYSRRMQDTVRGLLWCDSTSQFVGKHFVNLLGIGHGRDQGSTIVPGKIVNCLIVRIPVFFGRYQPPFGKLANCLISRTPRKYCTTLVATTPCRGHFQPRCTRSETTTTHHAPVCCVLCVFLAVEPQGLGISMGVHRSFAAILQ